MSSTDTKPVELRESWRPREDTGRGAEAKRWGRRLAYLTLLIALSALLLYLLFSPFWHPYPHWYFVGGQSQPAPQLPVIQEPEADFAALNDSLQLRYYAGQRGGPLRRVQVETRTDLAELADDLSSMSLGQSDILIVYLTAYGLSVDGEAFLLWQADTETGTNVIRYPLEQLLQQVAAWTSGIKLLLLDMGHEPYAPRWGMTISEVQELLCQQVADLDDPSVWVLTANSSMEQSYRRPADGKSYFGSAVSSALAGEGDLNDDLMIDLDELFRFVRVQVQQDVKRDSDGLAEQTPTLLRGGQGEVTKAESVVLLSVASLPGMDIPLDVESLASEVSSGELPNEGEPPATDSNASTQAAAAPANDASAGARPASAGSTDAMPQDAASGAENPPGPSSLLAPLPDADLLEPNRDATLRELVDFGWQLTDVLEQGPEANAAHLAASESPGIRRSWRRLLVEYEQLAASGADASTTGSSTRLRDELQGLYDLLAGRPLPEGDTYARRWSNQTPRWSVNPRRVRSLGLAEQLATCGANPLPEELRMLRDAFDAARQTDDRQAFDQFITESLPPARVDQYLEFWIAVRLQAMGELPWSLVQSTLAAFREGEKVAADADAWIPALQETCQVADRSRTEGWRALRDQIGGDWELRARKCLGKALAMYRQAEHDIDQLNRARHLRDELLWRSPCYLRWYRDAAGDGVAAPRPAELTELQAMLRKLCDRLEDLENLDLGALRYSCDQLTDIRSRIEAPLRTENLAILARSARVSSADRWRLRRLLRTPLLSGSDRRRLRETLAEISPEASTNGEEVVLELAASATSPKLLTAYDWKLAREQSTLDFGMAQLARLAPPDDEGEFDKVRAAYQAAFGKSVAEEESTNPRRNEAASASSKTATAELDRPSSSDGGWRSHRVVGRQLAEFYGGLSARALNATNANRDLTEPAQRSERLARLRGAARALAFVDVRDTDSWAGNSPRQILFEAGLFDVLAGQVRRSRAIREDAAPGELPFLLDAAQDFRRLAHEIPRQPQIPPDEPPEVQIDGAADLSLALALQADVELSLEFLGSTTGPVWLILQYDPQLLEVTTDESVTYYREDELRQRLIEAADTARQQSLGLETEQLGDDADPAASLVRSSATDVKLLQRAAQYPLRPDMVGFEPTLQMRPGEVRRLGLNVRRLRNTSGRTRLIVQAIAGATYLRHEIDVALPAIESIRLQANGPPGSWQATAQGLVLHPWPNRPTQYRLRMINESGKDRTVDLTWLALDQRPSATIPRGLLPAKAADELLQRLGPTRELMRYEQFLLPNGRAVDMPFPEPPKKDEPFPENQDLATGVVWLGGEEAEEDAAPPPSVRHGILVAARDRDAGQVLLRLIEFQPQRPQRYLRARVGYDLARERIDIRVSPVDPSLVPPDGIPVRCEFPTPLPPGTEAQIEGIIGSPNYYADLFIHVPPETRRVFPLVLTADGFPRAFSYRVPCWSSVKDVPETSDRLSARILSPEPGTAYAAPAETLGVQLQIDAPLGAFENGRDVVEIGIDADRDREFRDEPTWKLYSDRQAEIHLQAVGADGAIEFATQVGDFELQIPGSGYLNQRVNLLARVQVGDAQRWSDSVELILDAEPPKTLRVALQPARIAPMGKSLIATVTATDGQLSGVASVEAGFDVEGDGSFSDEMPPLPASRDDEGVWRVELPIDAPLELGQTTLLIRATDRVGNQSEMTKVDVVIVTPEEAEMLGGQGTNRVSGFVRYGGVALADAEVVLVDDKDAEYAMKKTDEKGYFLFPEVLRGVYRVRVRGLARNRPRLAEVTIEVAAPPGKPVRLTIDTR